MPPKSIVKSMMNSMMKGDYENLLNWGSRGTIGSTGSPPKENLFLVNQLDTKCISRRSRLTLRYLDWRRSAENLYYEQFLANFFKLCALLNKVKVWVCTEEMKDSFVNIKEAFRTVLGSQHLILNRRP